MKIEPSADHRAAAATLWQMYQAYLEQGFTEGQAIAFCIAMIQGAPHE